MVVTGIAVAYDFLDYPLGLRGVGVRSRIGFIRENKKTGVKESLTAETWLLDASREVIDAFGRELDK